MAGTSSAVRYLYRPEVAEYFLSANPEGPKKRGVARSAPGGRPRNAHRRFLIEIDDTADTVMAVHADNGRRRPLGITVWMAKKIAKTLKWREVV